MQETMSPASLVVLGTATLIVSPALWDAMVVGDLQLHVAMTRFLIAVVGCWFVLSMALSLLPTAAPKDVVRPEEADTPSV